jgi:endoribonuclease LACTB2
VNQASGAQFLPVAEDVLRLSLRTPTLLPATHTNSYVVGRDKIILVEPATPYPEEQATLIEALKSLERQGRTLTAVFATHHHPDHVGATNALQDAFGVPFLAHTATHQSLAHLGARDVRSVDETTDLAAFCDVPWRLWHTPGHARGHLCLVNETSGTALVGDMVASVGTILIAPGDGDMAVYLAQLERLQKAMFRVALPAHGEPILEPTARFAATRAHRLAREAKILSILPREEVQAASVESLVEHAYDDVAQELYPIASLSLLAHLAKLVDEGRARERENHWWREA